MLLLRGTLNRLLFFVSPWSVMMLCICRYNDTLQFPCPEAKVEDKICALVAWFGAEILNQTWKVCSTIMHFLGASGSFPQPAKSLEEPYCHTCPNHPCQPHLTHLPSEGMFFWFVERKFVLLVDLELTVQLCRNKKRTNTNSALNRYLK